MPERDLMILLFLVCLAIFHALTDGPEEEMD